MGTNNLKNEQLNKSANALRSKNIPVGPSEELILSTAEAMRIVARTPMQDVLPQVAPESQAGVLQSWTATVLRTLRLRKHGYASAFIILACIIAGVVGINGRAHRSFADTLNNVHKSTFTRYVYSLEWPNSGGGGVVILRCSASDWAVRTDGYEEGRHVMTGIVNLNKKTMLQLNLKDGRAYQGAIEQEFHSGYMNPFDIMTDFTGEDAAYVDTIRENGKTVDIYELSRLPNLGFSRRNTLPDDDGDSFKVWVDKETRLPTRILLHYKPFDKPHEDIEMKIDMKDFQWNVEFAPETFDMTIPSGFIVCEDARDLYPQAPVVEDHRHPPHPPHEKIDEHPHDHEFQHNHVHVEGQDEKK